jgi:flagellar hook-basal body complex protein FliE
VKTLVSKPTHLLPQDTQKHTLDVTNNNNDKFKHVLQNALGNVNCRKKISPEFSLKFYDGKSKIARKCLMKCTRILGGN